MDRNSAIGLTLIAAMLLAYFYWFSDVTPPEQPASAPAEQTVPPAADAQVLQPGPVPAEGDSLLQQRYGSLSAFVSGEEKIERIETPELVVEFSSRGGVIRSLELRKYKTYAQEPMILVDPAVSSFELLGAYNGQPVDLYDLYYQVDKRQSGDSTIVTFSLNFNDGAFFQHRYAVPASGYEIGYSMNSNGLDGQLAGDLRFNWKQVILPTEKDLTETRNRTTINYYTPADGFSSLPERSTSAEREVIEEPIGWFTFKQNFFLAGLIADGTIKGGDLAISTDVDDPSVVKTASVELLLNADSLAAGKAGFRYYLGPNDYQLIGDVAPKFSKNVYLGWPPVYWINKFIIFPVFHFLTLHIGNYGLIIIVLVILLKLVLAPLSYRSYLSMAKMKVLKPDLDAIKEKHGDDMTKVQQEQLKLYQQVGVNPISGCIPVLLQMPILFAMFYLFPASIELRQQPLLWAEDLSTYDSIVQFSFAIPFMGSHISLFTVLMTLSTLIYTWQNNQLSSVQGPMKSMSYIMPVIFFFVLNSFSAGLTFYYFVSNLVTFAQQAIIKRFVNEDKIKTILEENRKKNLGGGKKSKFMAKLEEAMKASESARKAAEENKKKGKK